MSSAEDRLLVLDAVARWSHAADARDAAALTKILTPDAAYRVGDGPAVEGRDVIASLVCGSGDRESQVRRHVRTTVIDAIDAASASARTYYLVTIVKPGGRPEPLNTGVYADELVKTPEGWRISARHARPDGTDRPEPRA